MAKRVFKNKKLVRNLIILAVLLFIGFFVWRAFFSGIKEGIYLQGDHTYDKLAEQCKGVDDEFSCTTNIINGLLKEPIEICEKRHGPAPTAGHGETLIVDETDTYQKCLQAEYEKKYNITQPPT